MYNVLNKIVYVAFASRSVVVEDSDWETKSMATLLGENNLLTVQAKYVP